MGAQLKLDWIACDGHGLCAELLPERIDLDEWGFPIIDERTIPPELAEHARRAVAACPKLALALVAARSQPSMPATRSRKKVAAN